MLFVYTTDEPEIKKEAYKKYLQRESKVFYEEIFPSIKSQSRNFDGLFIIDSVSSYKISNIKDILDLKTNVVNVISDIYCMNLMEQMQLVEKLNKYLKQNPNVIFMVNQCGFENDDDDCRDLGAFFSRLCQQNPVMAKRHVIATCHEYQDAFYKADNKHVTCIKPLQVRNFIYLKGYNTVQCAQSKLKIMSDNLCKDTLIVYGSFAAFIQYMEHYEHDKNSIQFMGFRNKHIFDITEALKLTEQGLSRAQLIEVLNHTFAAQFSIKLAKLKESNPDIADVLIEQHKLNPNYKFLFDVENMSFDADIYEELWESLFVEEI